jgi:ribokinase
MTGGGKGSNQALAAARLGAESYMIGCVGQDDFGTRLRGVLAENGVNCNYMETTGEACTGVAVITVTDEGESSIIISRGANSLLKEDSLKRAEEVFESADAAMFQMEIPSETVYAGLRMARRMGCKTFLSAEPPFLLPSEAWNCIDCMVLNERALNFYVTGSVDAPSREMVSGMASQLQKRGVRNVVVTRSAQGGLIFTEGRHFSFEPFKVHVVDNTGARDAFCAGLCVGLAEGMIMEKAARFASAAGALACTRIGAHPSLPWRREVEDLLEETAGDYAE